MIAYFLAQVFGECKIGIYTVKCWLYALGLYNLVKHFRVGILRGELEASAYMSPVNRAGSVSGILPPHSFFW